MAQHPNSPTWVGEQFISKYYDVLERLPKYLHRFYRENSTFTVTDEQPNGSIIVETASGTLEAIQEKVMATVANAVVASDKSLDAQFSQGGGVLLQVAGFMKLQGIDRRFVQTFFLATQEKGYYVLNDMLRIFPPEPVRDLRPLENGFAGFNVPVIPPPAFGLAPPPLASQLPPRVDMAPVMEPGLPVAPAPVAVPPVAAEAEPVVQDTAPAAPAPAPAPAPEVAAVPVAPEPVPAPVAPAPPVVPVPQPAPVPAPAPAVPAPVQPAPQQPAVAPAAPAPPPQNLSWAARAKLASATPPPPKPAPPAKPVPQPAPAPPAEAPAADVAPSAPAADAGAPADAPGEADAEVPAPDVLPPAVAGGLDNDPGFGVYVQGIPQTLPISDLEKLLSAQFTQFGAFGPAGVKIVRSPRFGMVAYVFYQDEKSRDAARESSGKLRLTETEKPVKILGALPEFERGFAQRPGGRGDRGRGSSVGSGYRGGRGGFDGVRGRGGRGEGGRGDRPPSGPGGRGGRGGERGGRGGGPGRGPRDLSSGPSVPKQA